VPIAQRKSHQTNVRTLLAEVRVSRGVNQHELARATGISVASIKRLERSEVASAPLWWYVNCSIALNVSLEELLDPELEAWRPTSNAAEPPAQDWLADRYERSVRWATDPDTSPHRQ
jgi:transcriptional regulator with XRE-family HTH domain